MLCSRDRQGSQRSIQKDTRRRDRRDRGRNGVWAILGQKGIFRIS